MKFFSSLFFSLSCLSLVDTQSQNAEIVVGSVQSLIASSRDLGVRCELLNPITLALLEPAISASFKLTMIPEITNLTQAIIAIQAPFDAVDIDTIEGLLLEFVAAQKSLLSILIDKYGLLSYHDYAESFRLTLVSLESAIDTLAIALIRLILDAGATFKQEFDAAYSQAIAVYSGSNKAIGAELELAHAYSAPAEAYYEYYLKVVEYYRKATEEAKLKHG